MFKRKLQSLDYYRVEEFDINDSLQIRQLIAWIEDHKIRHYKIEDRRALRDVDHKLWETAFRKYLSDIDCPFDANQIQLVLDWILTLAIRFEFEDNLEKYQNLNEKDIKREPQIVQNNPIDNLDFEAKEFKDGIKQLAQILKVPTHPTNHLITLKAICLLFRKNISMESKESNQKKPNDRTDMTRIEDNSTQLMVGRDPVLNNCAKLLRLLYISDLRQLQTKINEMIASVQSITANPKTDTNLGKVGF